MQDRYAGDIGDFGKIALLRHIRETGLTIGVNWYKVEPADYEKKPDGSYKQDDGKYCIPNKYCGCDEKLASILLKICQSEDNRSIKAIEEADLIAGAKYYNVPVSVENRAIWHKNALKKLNDAELVFLDPDNGMLVDSVKDTSARSIKYAFYEEVVSYLKNYQSVLVYNHRSRMKESEYFTDKYNRFLKKLEDIGEKNILAITFPRCSVRDYFAICATTEHYEMIKTAFDNMLMGPWGDKKTGICRRPILNDNEPTKSYKGVYEFQKANPTKLEKERALREMTNEQIDELIETSRNIQAKIFYSSFKKK